MSFEVHPLDPGLYLVATPIGSARDITLRALDILASSDVLAAEDTRTLRHLMSIHGVPLRDRPIIAYHDHNGEAVRPKLIDHIKQGRSVVYASEAGTPGIADPGFALVRAAREEDLHVTSAPGPSAVITALSIAGLPTDKFLFVGFPAMSAGQRRTQLTELKASRSTLVFYETPRRLDRFLSECLEVFGPDRRVAVCRELTKKFEDVRVARLGDIESAIQDMPRKGEIVVLIDRGAKKIEAKSLDAALRHALSTASLKEAARTVAMELGLPKREVYQRALAISKQQ